MPSGYAPELHGLREFVTILNLLTMRPVEIAGLLFRRQFGRARRLNRLHNPALGRTLLA
jgi:hypothetical protein